MKKAHVMVSALAVLSLLPPAEAVDRAQLEADLEQMVAWFEGRFDNYWQMRLDESENVEHPHGRIHSIFARIALPALGERVFYVQQYADGDPAQIYRQRFYSFRIHEGEKAVELVIFAPPDPAAVVDTHLDPSQLDALDVKSLRSYPGCEVYWRRQGRGTDDDHFVGYTKKDACRVVSSRSGRTLIISDDLRLDADAIWIQDRAVDENGNYVYGHKGGVPHKLRRVRFFDCWAAMPKDEEEEDWELWRPIEIHDQGGSYALVPPGAEEGTYSLELFQAVYSGENSVPVLELAIREKGQKRSIAYAWSDPRSERIGINLRILQTGCTLKAK